MLRRIILALIGLLAVENGSKWLFDDKRLPTLGLKACGTLFYKTLRYKNAVSKLHDNYMTEMQSCIQTT